jgi:hypothetical protein
MTSCAYPYSLQVSKFCCLTNELWNRPYVLLSWHLQSPEFVCSKYGLADMPLKGARAPQLDLMVDPRLRNIDKPDISASEVTYRLAIKDLNDIFSTSTWWSRDGVYFKCTREFVSARYLTRWSIVELGRSTDWFSSCAINMSSKSVCTVRRDGRVLSDGT